MSEPDTSPSKITDANGSVKIEIHTLHDRKLLGETAREKIYDANSFLIITGSGDFLPVQIPITHDTFTQDLAATIIQKVGRQIYRLAVENIKKEIAKL